MELATGDSVNHEVYGEVEVVGFITVSDEIEVYEIERDDGSKELDVVTTVQSDNVEFLDDEGRVHREPLEYFYQHAN